MEKLVRRYRAYRLLIVALVLVGLPAVLTMPAFLDERPIQLGEPSPRTVYAPSLIRVEDPEATDRARRDAAASEREVMAFDQAAQAAIVAQVRDAFATVAEVRRPAEGVAGPSPAPSPTKDEQLQALRQRLGMLDEEGLKLLVNMSDARLQQVANETIAIAQQLARQRITVDRLDAVITEQLQVELAVRDIAPAVARAVVEPLIRSALRPTVTVDEAASRSAREQAAATVAPVPRSFPAGSVIVSAGEVVSAAQYEALQRTGLTGSDPRLELLRAFAVVAVAAAAVGMYVRAHQARLWRSNRRMLLLAAIASVYTIILAAVVAASDTAPVSLYAVPAGAAAMLTTILLGPPVGVLIAVPVALLVAFVAPDSPGVVAFAATAALISVPFATRLSARGDLRRATVVAGGGYIVLAGAFAAVFEGPGEVPLAMVGGLIHAVASAVIVLGGLPFVESAFGIVTATGLIDLADRNHPLLRELEQKAIGSYNHSVVVSTLVERACRAIGADALLGSVAALYHDIGKVRRPYFFVENQFGVPNPHDGLEPDVSALIIQEHVSDGIEMARTYRLPPEVVEGIATHHGTTLVTYFYRKALRDAADGEVEETVFRYKGRRPSTKETAVLMLADCCEAASRAAAQQDRNLSTAQLEDLVESLVEERVRDGQLDESPLTFQDLATVKASLIETLVGVYHPRISYPPEEARTEIAGLVAGPDRRDGDDAGEADEVPDPTRAAPAEARAGRGDGRDEGGS